MSYLPLVSIVTPSYNQAQFLEETILSVLNQDYPNLEYIIIDGGSADGSVEIIRKYEKRLSYWVSEPDKGQAEAINKGWLRSKGEIITYINSDDTYESQAVSTVVKTFQKHPEVYLVYGDENFIDENGKIFERFLAPDFDLRTFIGDRCYIRQTTAFFKHSVLAEVGMLNIQMHYAFDYDFFIRICSRFPVRHIPYVIANFRYHPASKTMSGNATHGRFTFWPEERHLLDEVGQNPQFPLEVRALALRRIGIYYYDRREMKLTRKMFLRAMLTYKPLLVDRNMLYLLFKALLGKRIVEAVNRIKKSLLELTRKLC